jgi:hypothetical protein
MRPGRTRSACASAAAVVALALFGCAAKPDGESDLAKPCVARGLTPGSDAFVQCVGSQRLQQQLELEHIRQAREAARGGTKL